ncbi:MAG: membrane protein insertion efficiency factor YidD [Clostridia bacterium]|nr:membrane protein insertion efficiency factor YidD [Clostridia bacterium]MBR3862224.1 membrane protein insertion efficiency factor YidD [Clostridia bacterium]
MSRQIREVLVKDLILYAPIPAVALVAIWLIGVLVVLPHVAFPPFAVILILCAISYWPFRCLLIGLVLLYKVFAPMRIRSECRFQPTCSTYMIRAVQKYGVIVGVFKGIRRILRCHPPNGGIDEP